MKKEQIFSLFKDKLCDSNILMDEPMKNHTYFRIGGNVDIMIMPSSIEDLSEALKLCKTNNIEYYVVGNCTNLLVRDKGIRGVVIKIDENFNDIRTEGNKIIAQAGGLVSKIANIALKNELTGFEGLSGIPGSLGGAVAMNAGAYGYEIKDVVVKVRCINSNGELVEYSNDEMDFGYRHSKVQEQSLIVVEAEIELNKGSYNEIKRIMNDFTKRRTAKQPLNMPSAGSTFKRPKGDYASRLIDVAGLKGVRHGNAQVSDKHCGFVVNLGGATCDEVLDLIKFVQKTINDKYGILLETEVKIIGEE